MVGIKKTPLFLVCSRRRWANPLCWSNLPYPGGGGWGGGGGGSWVTCDVWCCMSDTWPVTLHPVGCVSAETTRLRHVFVNWDLMGIINWIIKLDKWENINWNSLSEQIRHICRIYSKTRRWESTLNRIWKLEQYLKLKDRIKQLIITPDAIAAAQNSKTLNFHRTELIETSLELWRWGE